MKIVFVAPYKAKVLKTVETLEKVKLGEVLLVGSSEVIGKVSDEERIKIRSKIIEANDADIVLKSKEVIDKETIIVFDSILEYHQKQILNVCNYQENEELNYFYVIDIPELKHFIFVSNHSMKRHLDFDDKKKAIVSIFDFMNCLGIKKSNVAIITDRLTKTDILEVNLIKMILKEDVCKNVNVLSPCRIDELFSKKYHNNVYDKNINLLVFKNYDITQTFINTLGLFSSNKIASICNIKNNLYIDASNQYDERNILFSILLISKYLKEKSFSLDYRKIKIFNKKEYVENPFAN